MTVHWRCELFRRGATKRGQVLNWSLLKQACKETSTQAKKDTLLTSYLLWKHHAKSAFI